uniref:Uncharacterized protein n=1 Tax=Musa acuminata subsp. malaccensis TaxID=214687 RepID=A0A804L854_MUSAM
MVPLCGRRPGTRHTEQHFGKVAGSTRGDITNNILV